MAKTLDEIDNLYETIYGYRTDIAKYNRERIEQRASAWDDTSDIKLAKAKEDYVRSAVAEYDEKIAFAEAEIERAYNKIKLLEWELCNA